jgi:hypothetical protein
MRYLSNVFIVLATFLQWENLASAAILSGSVNTSLPATPGSDLTALGTLDWAYWGRTTSSNLTTQPLINRKSGGPNIFSVISPVTGTNVRGGISSDHTFIFSDGQNSPTSLNTNDAGLIFNSTLDSVGRGVSFTVQGDPGELRQLLVWGSGTNGQGTLTASLNGASSVPLLSQVYTGKTGTLFTINYQPDNASDLLMISYALTTDGSGTNSHVGLVAAAVSVIPEPSSYFLVAFGIAAIYYMRRQ